VANPCQDRRKASKPARPQAWLRFDRCLHSGREEYSNEEAPGFNFGHPDFLEDGAQASEINNFQARYIIRHDFPEPLTCEQPSSMQWGGKEGGPDDEMIGAARNAAFQARKNSASLADWIAEDVPSLGLEARKKRVYKHVPQLENAGSE
jgi:hypothetical protein